LFGLRLKFPEFLVRVYTVMIEDAKSQTLRGMIRDRIQPDSIVYPDSFRSCDVLDVSEFHHVRINHSMACAKLLPPASPRPVQPNSKSVL
jgi:transposase-like protein